MGWERRRGPGGAFEPEELAEEEMAERTLCVVDSQPLARASVNLWWDGGWPVDMVGAWKHFP